MCQLTDIRPLPLLKYTSTVSLHRIYLLWPQNSIFAPMAILEVSAITKQAGDRFTLGPVTFSQQLFRKMAIAGETGSGKSTLLQIIAGLEQADAGTVHFEGRRVKGALEQMMPGHPRIAYLSQHYELRHRYRVEELLDMANKMPQQEADAIYALCRIDHLVKRKTDQLSGGEKQRIALARLLITRPGLLLLDEPFSNMDMIHKRILRTVIDNISQQLDITCILTAHDPQDYLSWADEVIVMKDGNIVQQATPQDLYRQPLNEYVAALTGGYTLLPADILRLFPGHEHMTGDKTTMIRPEHLLLARSGVAARVQKVSFYGNWYEVRVSMQGYIITVAAPACAAAAGDEVFLSLPQRQVWSMDINETL